MTLFKTVLAGKDRDSRVPFADEAAGQKSRHFFERVDKDNPLLINMHDGYFAELKRTTRGEIEYTIERWTEKPRSFFKKSEVMVLSAVDGTHAKYFSSIKNMIEDVDEHRFAGIKNADEVKDIVHTLEIFGCDVKTEKQYKNTGKPYIVFTLDDEEIAIPCEGIKDNPDYTDIIKTFKKEARQYIQYNYNCSYSREYVYYFRRVPHLKGFISDVGECEKFLLQLPFFLT